MFNTPRETSFTMDLAKMLAKIELIESLHDDDFRNSKGDKDRSVTVCPPIFNYGKGQLGSSTMLQMQIDPSIVHVVAYCESSYAAKPQDIIESSEIVLKVIENCLEGCPDMKNDSRVMKRKEELVKDASLIIERIRSLDVYRRYEDPLAEPGIIAMAIKKGILDAPHLEGAHGACGSIRTFFYNGANFAVSGKGEIISEKDRLDSL